jgi:hypothetical protein
MLAVTAARPRPDEFAEPRHSKCRGFCVSMVLCEANSVAVVLRMLHYHCESLKLPGEGEMPRAISHQALIDVARCALG